MNSPKRLVLILGDQLDLNGAALRTFDIKTDEIVMIESIPEAQYVWSHKAKIALFLSAMRHFAIKLKELNYPLTYIQA
jgi:deoxyribodipyrimidine photolyase-related protein